MKKDLFTFGESLSVFISTDSDSVLTGRFYERVTAGAEVNVAVALARLGMKSVYFSRFGQDQLGEVMIKDIAAEGVDVSKLGPLWAAGGGQISHWIHFCLWLVSLDVRSCARAQKILFHPGVLTRDLQRWR